MSEREQYEVFAVKYAHKADRMASQNLIFSDLHDRPMPLDYFVWVIRNENRTYVVDCGFGERESKERGVPLEWSLVARPGPVLLTGRSGTAKTTLLLYRARNVRPPRPHPTIAEQL